MPLNKIIIKGARQHNLKNIDLEIPRDKLIVLTGVSGSGKSSLAFDTIYAEGQRRYVESLSAYARQFLGLMDKPDVDLIDGLSPAISIDQKSVSHNPRSIVGTVTEIYDYLRVLFARIGHPHCWKCGRPISQQTVDQMVDQIMSMDQGTKLQLLSPVVRGRKGEYKSVLEEIRRAGFLRVRIDGKMVELEDEINLDKNKKHNIEVIVDRIIVKPDVRSRLAESLETTLKMGEGIAIVSLEGGEELLLSEKFACPYCGVSMEELSPRIFSFNSPYGACPECSGLGFKMEVDPDLVIPDKNLPLMEAIAPWVPLGSYHASMLEALGEELGFYLTTPVRELTDEQLKILLYGDPNIFLRFSFWGFAGQKKYVNMYYKGIIPMLEAKYVETESDYSREEIEQYMRPQPCPSCNGKRLKPESLAVKIGGKSIAEIIGMVPEELIDFINNLQLTERETYIAHQLLKEIKARLQFLIDVGLDYISLERPAATLSGGEAQRIRLATQIGSGLMGVLYILDEPSIGLHARDESKLIETLKKLRDLGNTVIVVEHDESMMRSADYIVDIGPGAGENGGYLVASGTLEEIMRCEESITGQYLSGKRSIPIPARRREPNGKYLTIVGAKEHNLKDITVNIPLGVLVLVTGVSGSGKSTLVNDILYKALERELHRARVTPGKYGRIIGIENVDKVINIDQSPIGRTPRSNPATYTGVFDDIRKVFAETHSAKTRGYKPGRFSFNVKGGRCEACHGDGMIKIEMHFLPDVYVPCEVCNGKRYNRETLEVKYKGASIADVLDMTVDQALIHFENVPAVRQKLQTLQDVGLGYIKLGQPAPTLSGGEAQRVKLASELSRKSTGKTLYILDEPTTGLHFADIEKLINVLQRLVDMGNTVVVIEHNLDVIKVADYIIDLGPEGGDKGGYIIAEGTPEEISKNPKSYTGMFLKRVLKIEEEVYA
ncbi:MAG TPA: excinuclease ABC subunit UvrA [bacterium]|nr:excinuclease ABC subunit UvrA [Dictyoglomota bacterium]HOK29593.1 excinuclease ABC subunit UvrA [bacterium]HON71723.1 excinuclease ABC subunit UvrA [bacterium]HPO82022.1 excinuclease ABC subunit UvrA [bacterium]